MLTLTYSKVFFCFESLMSFEGRVLSFSIYFLTSFIVHSNLRCQTILSNMRGIWTETTVTEFQDLWQVIRILKCKKQRPIMQFLTQMTLSGSDVSKSEFSYYVLSYELDLPKFVVGFNSI